MNHNEREQFWQTLCSLPGNDIVAEREQLLKSIKYPKLLFRYAKKILCYIELVSLRKVTSTDL